MEEKKPFDFKSFIGIMLIGAIVLFWLNTKQKEEAEKQQNDRAQKEQVDTAATKFAETSEQAVYNDTLQAQDSTAIAQKAAGLVESEVKEDTIVVENELLKLKVSTKGGQIVEARLKDMSTFYFKPVYLVKDDNASLNLKFTTTNHQNINTKNIYFKPSLTRNGGNQVLTMRAQMGDGQYLEYVYTIKPDNYMVGFNINSQGLKNVISQSEPVNLNWKVNGLRHDRGLYFEKRFTNTDYLYKDKKHSKQRSGETEEEDLKWVAYRQHHFTSVLLNDSGFKKGTIKTKEVDEDKDTLHTKTFASTFVLDLKGGEVNENLDFYYGPTDYKLLKSYGHDLRQLVPLGWGIFGWINKFIFIPVFNFLMGFLPAGIAIIVLTVIVKIVLSPVQYKQFLSQAKRKVLQPEIDELNKKFKDNKMKLQQETMKLNRKAGINMTSGCLVGLIQMPIFIALYELFPSAFNLRHESFFWAKDLSSYDEVFHLPFHIPLYGDHVSLFALLAAIAIFFYMLLTTGQSMNNMPKQPGMPNMKFIMYLSPIFMLVFFNRYPSGMSLYYMTSNLLSVCIYLVIQYFIIDEAKVHAKIQESKKKPKKQGRFQKKMAEMMEEAERQKRMKK